MAQVWQAVTQVLWFILFVLAVEFVILGFFLRSYPFFRRLGRDLLLLATASAIPVWLSAWNPFLDLEQTLCLLLKAVFSLGFCSCLASSAFTVADTMYCPDLNGELPPTSGLELRVVRHVGLPQIAGIQVACTLTQPG